MSPTRPHLICAAMVAAAAAGSAGWRQAAEQPKVAPGPNEPDWSVLLDKLYGRKMFADLANPVETSVDRVPGLFRKAGPGPVGYRPILALGLETVNRGGWYRPLDRPERVETWSYRHKHASADFGGPSKDQVLKAPEPPPLLEGSKIEFDPGDAPFGLWVSNDGLKESDAYTEPKVVRKVNPRLAKQPYKAMIYRFKDPKTGEIPPHSYLIGFEYSTNDDFQDIVARVDNVDLVDPPRD